jgi:hypothetical protein
MARPIKAASAGAARIAKLEISEVEELPRSPFAELDSQAQSFNAMLVHRHIHRIHIVC